MDTKLPPLTGSPEGQEKIFSYNQELPLDIVDAGVEYKDRVSIHDISYAGSEDRRVRAYLVRPQKKGPFASVIFVHPGPGSRSSFLDEAVELGGMGAASLPGDAPWSDAAKFANRAMQGPQAVRDMVIETTIDLMRGVDLQSSLPEADESQIAYVGHSYGALFGGVLSGIEKRIGGYVLMAGTRSFADVAALNMPNLKGQELEAYRAITNPVDPINYIGRAAPSRFFFQYGLQDQFFPRQYFLDYYQAASDPKSIKWYEADHYSLNEEGRRDRVAWLKAELQIQRDV